MGECQERGDRVVRTQGLAGRDDWRETLTLGGWNAELYLPTVGGGADRTSTIKTVGVCLLDKIFYDIEYKSTVGTMTNRAEEDVSDLACGPLCSSQTL